MSDCYYTLSEKQRYIEDDFKQSIVCRFGKLPDDPSARLQYVRLVKSSILSWLAKYEQNSQKGYALALVSDFISSIERSAEV